MALRKFDGTVFQIVTCFTYNRAIFESNRPQHIEIRGGGGGTMCPLGPGRPKKITL